MILMYESGMSLYKIRENLKIDKNNIKEILIQNKVWIEGRDNTKKINDYSKEEIDNIISLYKSGLSLSSLGKKLKKDKRVIRKILIQNNKWIEKRDDLKIEFSEEERKNILVLYINEKLSTKKIADVYGISKATIKRLLNEYGVLRKGYSNGRKIELTEEQKEKIKVLYLIEYKNSDEIGVLFGCSGNFIDNFLKKNGLMRSRSEGVSVGLVKRFNGIRYNEYLERLSEYKKYRRETLKITNKQPIFLLPNFEKRGVSGSEGAYQLDHKYSILQGFNDNIKPEIIGCLSNLEFIPWEENARKRTKCSINKEELINT